MVISGTAGELILRLTGVNSDVSNFVSKKLIILNIYLQLAHYLQKHKERENICKDMTQLQKIFIVLEKV